MSAVRKTPSPGGRIAQLDVLRGVAILLVLGAHSPLHPDQAGWWAPLATYWARGGVTGVDLFFVLSGFLIGGLLFKEARTQGSIDVKRFLIRRGFRIWPLYYLWLLCAFLHLSLHLGVQGAFLRFVPNLIHLQNYIAPWGLAPYAHTWTLAVEEHFYLALPFLILLALRLISKKHVIHWVPLFALVITIIATGVRLYNASQPYHTYLMEAPTHVRMDALFFGVLLAYFQCYRPERLDWIPRFSYPLLGAGVLLVSPNFFDTAQQLSLLKLLRFNTTYVGYGLILLVAIYASSSSRLARHPITRTLVRAVSFVGVYSYPIYLWHIPFVVILARYLALHTALAGLPPELRWLVCMGLYVGTAVGVGYLSGTLIEKPTLALRDRLFPSRLATPTASELVSRLPESRPQSRRAWK